MAPGARVCPGVAWRWQDAVEGNVGGGWGRQSTIPEPPAAHGLTAARHEGSVILDTATPADPGGLRDAQPPGGGRA